MVLSVIRRACVVLSVIRSAHVVLSVIRRAGGAVHPHSDPAKHENYVQGVTETGHLTKAST